VHGTVSRIAVNRITADALILFFERREENPLAGLFAHAGNLPSAIARRLLASLFHLFVQPRSHGYFVRS
jgi:hypothetical protein